MKKFKFYALAFAAILFAGCSDDAIDGQGGNTGAQGDGTPAYLTISFSANSGNSSRSTADDANNNGDKHNAEGSTGQEDSGHHNDGTTNETTVDKILVVVVPTNGGNVNYAKSYNVSTDATGTADSDDFTLSNETYSNENPIELTTGKYNVVVVANPVSDLISGISGDINAGISNSNAVENLYTKITTGDYNPVETDYVKIAKGQPLGTEQDAKFRVMMANKELNSNLTDKTYTVELSTTNTADNPAKAEVQIERVYSKITFRPKTGENPYVYEVPVRAGEVEAKTVPAAINVADEESEASYEYRDLNVALDAGNNEVYVLWEQKEGDPSPMEFKGVYGPTGTEQNVTLPGGGTGNVEVYTELEASTTAGEGKYVVKDTSNPQESLIYQSDEIGIVDHWYVRLEGYALVNLSKNVYYTRHTTDNLGQSPFGTLNGSNYLYTPYWSEKNNDANIVTAAGTGEISFVNDTWIEGETSKTAPISEKWFYNTLAQVSEVSKTLTISGTEGSLSFKKGDGGTEYAYYQAMPGTTTYEDGENTVTGGNHTGSGNPDIGNFMAYCFENSTDIDHQMHGISTGISFVARIYANQECTTQITTLYRYNNHLFESLEDIQKSYGANFMSSKFNELVEQEKTNKTITKADLEDLANFDAEGNAKDGETIYLYQDGICYYYTTEIKHFDNGDNASLGNMEFAIMRNNIYSLAVTDINRIGDPFVDPTPNLPNENPEVKAALDVEVKIVPWIVRYNDIEF